MPAEATIATAAGPPFASRWYGPRVVTTSSLVLALTAPGQTAAISAFVDPLIHGLHISRTTVSAAYLAGTLAGAAAMPLFGRGIDRFGARRLMVWIGLAFGAALTGLSAVSGIAGLTAGFVGIRLLGQGALNLTATTAVAVYIERSRGLAQGITAAIGTAGIALAPVLLESQVAQHGFRTVWLAEGLTIWAAVIPLALAGLPRRPQPAPPQPARPAAPRHRRPLPPVDWTRRQAMRTPMFWVVAGGVAVVALLGTGLTFNQISLLGERGLTPAQAAANFIPQMAAGLAATLLTGYLADRVPDRALIIASLAVLTAALAAAGYVTPGWSAIGYAIAIGVAGNSFRIIEATAFPACFGLTHIGAIRGVVHTVTVAGSAFGPLLLALGHAWAGSYRPVVLALTALPLATITFAAIAPSPLAAQPLDRPTTGPGRQQAG